MMMMKLIAVALAAVASTTTADSEASGSGSFSVEDLAALDGEAGSFMECYNFVKAAVGLDTQANVCTQLVPCSGV